jgi:hypothetical protein
MGFSDGHDLAINWARQGSMGKIPPVAVEHAPNGSQRSPPVMNMVLAESFMSWPRRVKAGESIREAIAEHR